MELNNTENRETARYHIKTHTNCPAIGENDELKIAQLNLFGLAAGFLSARGQ